MLYTTLILTLVIAALIFLFRRLNGDKVGVNLFGDHNSHAPVSNDGSMPGIVNFRQMTKTKLYRCGINSPTLNDANSLYNEPRSIRILIDLRMPTEISKDHQNSLSGKFTSAQIRETNIMGRDFETGLFVKLPWMRKICVALLLGANSWVKWTGLPLKTMAVKISIGWVRDQDLLFHNKVMLQYAQKSIASSISAVMEQDVCEWDDAHVDQAVEAAKARNIPACIYCSIGKDRTGLISALFQLIAGVSKDEIVADYVVSSRNLEPYLPYLTWSISRTGLRPEVMLSSLESTIMGVLDFIDELGGHEKYLEEQCGISRVEQAWIRRIIT